MKVNFLKKSLVIWTICLLILIFIPTAPAETDYYNNSFVIIFGKSNDVRAFSLWWRIGLYIPILKRGFTLRASEEGESLTAIIYKLNGGAFYLDNENISIDISRARGLFYWGGKSLLINYSSPPPVFVICRAKTVYVNTYN